MPPLLLSRWPAPSPWPPAPRTRKSARPAKPASSSPSGPRTGRAQETQGAGPGVPGPLDDPDPGRSSRPAEGGRRPHARPTGRAGTECGPRPEGRGRPLLHVPLAVQRAGAHAAGGPARRRARVHRARHDLGHSSRRRRRLPGDCRGGRRPAHLATPRRHARRSRPGCLSEDVREPDRDHRGGPAARCWRNARVHGRDRDPLVHRDVEEVDGGTREPVGRPGVPACAGHRTPGRQLRQAPGPVALDEVAGEGGLATPAGGSRLRVHPPRRAGDERHPPASAPVPRLLGEVPQAPRGGAAQRCRDGPLGARRPHGRRLRSRRARGAVTPDRRSVRAGAPADAARVVRRRRRTHAFLAARPSPGPRRVPRPRLPVPRAQRGRPRNGPGRGGGREARGRRVRGSGDRAGRGRRRAVLSPPLRSLGDRRGPRSTSTGETTVSSGPARRAAPLPCASSPAGAATPWTIRGAGVPTSGATTGRWTSSAAPERTCGTLPGSTPRRSGTRRGFEPRSFGHWSLGAPALGYAPDVLVYLGYGVTRTSWGFRTLPNKSEQTLRGALATGNDGRATGLCRDVPQAGHRPRLPARGLRVGPEALQLLRARQRQRTSGGPERLQDAPERLLLSSGDSLRGRSPLGGSRGPGSAVLPDARGPDDDRGRAGADRCRGLRAGGLPRLRVFRLPGEVRPGGERRRHGHFSALRGAPARGGRPRPGRRFRRAGGLGRSRRVRGSTARSPPTPEGRGATWPCGSAAGSCGAPTHGSTRHISEAPTTAATAAIASPATRLSTETPRCTRGLRRSRIA